MKIDVLASSRELFGSDRSAVRLCEALQTLGHQVTLVLPQARPERGLAEFASARNVDVAEAPVAIVSSGRPGSLLALRPGRGTRPDLTILNSSSILDSARPSGRRILVIREWLQPTSIRHRALMRWHGARASMVVGVSTGVLRQWSAYMSKPAARSVIWNWLEDDWLTGASPTAGRSGIVCLGRFNQWKGQELLADAYDAAFRDRGDPPELAFVGAQPSTEFAGRAQAVRDRGEASGNWSVRDFVGDVRETLSRAELLVVPSLRPEPFGMVILEALATGCTVLASTGGGPDDLAPLFPGVLTTASPTVEGFRNALRSWSDAPEHAQTDDQKTATHATLNRLFAAKAGAKRWAEALAALQLVK